MNQLNSVAQQMAVKHGPRKAESSPGELIHRFGELDIELRQSAGIVCRQGYIDGFVDIGPFPDDGRAFPQAKQRAP